MESGGFVNKFNRPTTRTTNFEKRDERSVPSVLPWNSHFQKSENA